MWYLSMEKVAGLHVLRSSIFPVQIILISFQRLWNWHNLLFCVPHLKICILANFLMLFSTQVFKVVCHNFCIKVVAWMQGATGYQLLQLFRFRPGTSETPAASDLWRSARDHGKKKEEWRNAYVWAQIFIEREMSGYEAQLEAGRTIDNNN